MKQVFEEDDEVRRTVEAVQQGLDMDGISREAERFADAIISSGGSTTTAFATATSTATATASPSSSSHDPSTSTHPP